MPAFSVKKQSSSSTSAHGGTQYPYHLAAPIQCGSDSASIRSTVVSMASSNTGATLNAFKSTLDILGERQIPGIGTVTTPLLRVINGLQQTPQDGPGWQQLVERMERLTFLVHKIGEYPKTADRAEDLCRPLKDALEKLSYDIDAASKQGTLPVFLDSTDELSSIAEHGRKLDNIVRDLTLGICARTPLTAEKLEEGFQNAISPIREEIPKGASLSGMIMRMSNNEFSQYSFFPILSPESLTVDTYGIEGNLDAYNITVGGEVKMIREIHGNKFGKVKGRMFSNNEVYGSGMVQDMPKLQDPLTS